MHRYPPSKHRRWHSLGVYQIRAKRRACPAHSAPMGSLINSVPRNAAERPPTKLVPVRSGGHPDCVWLTKQEGKNTSLRHVGINDVNLCMTGLIPKRPFRVCPVIPSSLGRKNPSSRPALNPLFQYLFLGSCLSVAVFGWGLNDGAIPVPSLHERCCCRQTAGFTSSVKFCEFWTLFKTEQINGDFPLFAVSFGAAVIVLHLLEHF